MSMKLLVDRPWQRLFARRVNTIGSGLGIVV
jgi:hypothetical protein